MEDRIAVPFALPIAVAWLAVPCPYGGWTALPIAVAWTGEWTAVAMPLRRLDSRQPMAVKCRTGEPMCLGLG